MLWVPDLPHLVHHDIREQFLKGEGILADLEESMFCVLEGCFALFLLVWWVPRLHLHGLHLD